MCVCVCEYTVTLQSITYASLCALRMTSSSIYHIRTRLSEIRKCSGMEMKVEKTKVMRISRQSSPVQMTDKKQLKYLNFFNWLVRMITNNGR